MSRLGVTPYGISLYNFIKAQQLKLDRINKEYMDLLHETEKIIESGDKDKLAENEREQAKYRDLLAELGYVPKLFSKYQDCIQEIADVKEMMNQSKEEGEGEMVQMLEEDLIRLFGTDEEYGLIEEIQEEIVDAILPETDADKQNQCTLEIMQAAGGSESSLFAEEIGNMYLTFCNKMNFRMKLERF